MTTTPTKPTAAKTEAPIKPADDNLIRSTSRVATYAKEELFKSSNRIAELETIIAAYQDTLADEVLNKDGLEAYLATVEQAPLREPQIKAREQQQIEEGHF